MSGTRTEAACLEASMAAPLRPIMAMVADVTDAGLFPEMALARLHYASLSPERRAELEAKP